MKRFWKDLRKFWSVRWAFRIYKRMSPKDIEAIYVAIDTGKVRMSDWLYVLRTARP